MALKKLFVIVLVAAVLVACGDDDSSDFATRPSGDSSSACEDCDDLSSSKVKSSSSFSVTPQSSERETSVSSSSSAKSSSSEKKTESSSSMTSSSSSSVDSSSSSVMSSSSSDGSSSSSAMSSSSDASSSCSSVKSSSSLAKSSSSIAYVEPCRTDSVDTCEYGTLTDERDGQTYKTVKIGDQVWMAENLNYAYTGVPFIYGGIITDSTTRCYGDDESNCMSLSDSTGWFCFGDDGLPCLFTSDSSSWCYNDDPANCAKYGRLYTWAAAIDSVKLVNDAKDPQDCGDGKICTLPAKVQGICPTGWHLPNETEWKTLFTAVGSIVAGSYSDAHYHSAAGKMLKSTSGWMDYEYEGRKNGNGTDAFGFSALPAGQRLFTGDFSNEGKSAHFWCSAELNRYHACDLDLYYGNSATLEYSYKSSGYPVRCVKD